MSRQKATAPVDRPSAGLACARSRTPMRVVGDSLSTIARTSAVMAAFFWSGAEPSLRLMPWKTSRTWASVVGVT